MLYRGVCKRMYEEAQGKLLPKGTQSEVTPKYDGKGKYDGRLTYGKTEDNAVRAQHIESGAWGNCFVSTSRSPSLARVFATRDGELRSDGYIYCIDEDLCRQYGVIMRDLPNPLYPGECEVSIRAENCGQIPEEVIVKVVLVSPD